MCTQRQPSADASAVRNFLSFLYTLASSSLVSSVRARRFQHLWLSHPPIPPLRSLGSSGRGSPQFPPDHAPNTTAFAYSMASTFAGGTSSQMSSMLGFGPAATAPFFGSSGEQQSQRLQQYYQSPQRQQPAPAMPHTERPSAPGRRSGKVKFFDTQKVSAVGTRSGCLAGVSPSCVAALFKPTDGSSGRPDGPVDRVPDGMATGPAVSASHIFAIQYTRSSMLMSISSVCSHRVLVSSTTIGLRSSTTKKVSRAQRHEPGVVTRPGFRKGWD